MLGPSPIGGTEREVSLSARDASLGAPPRSSSGVAGWFAPRDSCAPTKTWKAPNLGAATDQQISSWELGRAAKGQNLAGWSFSSFQQKAFRSFSDTDLTGAQWPKLQTLSPWQKTEVSTQVPKSQIITRIPPFLGVIWISRSRRGLLHASKGTELSPIRAVNSNYMWQ